MFLLLYPGPGLDSGFICNDFHLARIWGRLTSESGWIVAFLVYLVFTGSEQPACSPGIVGAFLAHPSALLLLCSLIE